MPAKFTSVNTFGNREDGNPHLSNPTSILISEVKDEMAEGEEAGYESEEEGVKRWLIDAPHKRRKITEKKRADAAAFAVELEKDFKRFTDHDNTPLGDQEKSLTWLVRDFESEKIIASPRDYQIELFEKAKLQNTIAVLDTGMPNLIGPYGMMLNVTRIWQDTHRCSAATVDYRKGTRGQSSREKEANLFLPCRQGGLGLPTICRARLQSGLPG
jgi:hypothetical protein